MIEERHTIQTHSAQTQSADTNRRPPLIAIVGGVASGKSFVSEHLVRKGAAIVSADDLAHEVLKIDEVKQAICNRWGTGLLGPDGQIDRPRLAAIVFAPPPDGPRERKILEGLTHPRIGQLIREKTEQLQQDSTVRAIVLDVPLIVESGRYKECDKVLFVDAPRDVREARAIARGWTADEFARREAVQQSLDAKRALAHAVIDNSGSEAQVIAQIEDIWPMLIGP